MAQHLSPNSERRVRINNGPFGKVVQGLAATVGFASETYQHQKKKPSSDSQADRISRRRSLDAFPSSYPSSPGEQSESILRPGPSPIQLEKRHWSLNDAHGKAAAMTGGKHSLGNTGLGNSSPNFENSSSPPSTTGLQLPVVITQRRPKARTRGFIRAYAPALQDVGIDQATFLDFLDQLNKAVEPSPWITAIDLASLAGHAFPEPIHLLISASALMITEATAEAQSRSKSNKFLDKANDDFFKPKGLLALLVTWKPGQKNTKASTTVDVNLSAVESPSDAPSLGETPAGRKQSNPTLEASSIEPLFELPEFAPLIFPDLEAKLQYHTPPLQTRNSQLIEPQPAPPLPPPYKEEPQGCLNLFRRGSDTTLQQVKQGSQSVTASVKRTNHFIGDYRDRRAVARWTGQHPDSKMARLGPQPAFASKYADPNHPAGSGDFVALVTGGKHTTAGVRRGAVDRVRMGVEGAGLGGETVRPVVLGPRAREAFGFGRVGSRVARVPRGVMVGGRGRTGSDGSLDALSNGVKSFKTLLKPVSVFLKSSSTVRGLKC